MLKRLKRRRKNNILRLAAQGQDGPLTVRRSKRASRMTLSVNEAKRTAILTLPAYTSMTAAGDFLDQHYDWLQERLAAMPRPVPFEHGAVIPLRGVEHDLRFTATQRGRGVVWIERAPRASGRATQVRPRIMVTGGEHAPRRLTEWLRKEARRDISERATIHAKTLKVRVRRITIRDQTTRWGSCSAEGALSFSWRLILAPSYVLDYVTAHEVAHLREMNHEPRFWALVRRAFPGMERAKQWLRRNGSSLHRYGAED
ncbi:MAG: SprT family zinc-dependent metalloprotease [Pseudomonadota bacterium]|nr:SprT family zinc-dependent metalloprotease [Pseudomonadota bacterium]